MLEPLTSLDAQQEKWQDSSQVLDNFLSFTTTWSKKSWVWPVNSFQWNSVLFGNSPVSVIKSVFNCIEDIWASNNLCWKGWKDRDHLEKAPLNSIVHLMYGLKNINVIIKDLLTWIECSSVEWSCPNVFIVFPVAFPLFLITH